MNAVVPSSSEPGTTVSQPSASANDTLEALEQILGFVSVEFNNQPTATFDWNAHDDATALLRDLHGTVSGTGLHSCHVTLPQSLGSGATPIIPYPGPFR